MHDDLVAQLGRRVQRLERSTGVGGPCPAWGGLGRDEVQVVFEPEARRSLQAACAAAAWARSTRRCSCARCTPERRPRRALSGRVKTLERAAAMGGNSAGRSVASMIPR